MRNHASRRRRRNRAYGTRRQPYSERVVSNALVALLAALPHLRSLASFAHECWEHLAAALEDGTSREPDYDRWDLAELDALLTADCDDGAPGIVDA